MVELDKMNKWIESHIQSVIEGKGINMQNSQTKGSGIKGTYRFNYHGIMLPFQTNGGDDENPWIMVRIIPQLN